MGDWGAGRVELLQFRTPDETHDNIVAYWVPATLPQPGEPIELAWRVNWQGQQQRCRPAPACCRRAPATATRKVPPPPSAKFVIDFAAPAYAQLEPTR